MTPRLNDQTAVPTVAVNAAHPSIAYFTGAYPGQAVVKGRPNRLRRAAHYARAAYIAAQSGNAALSAAWTAVLKKLPLELDELAEGREGD
ncbi:hypothetical protein [Roseateles sp.]|uniref:hypothetical protein n=1 Tax=Roseateles sp. TaxID=1971397 RepID=UPI003264A2A4